jgi:hypothetical protein
VLSYSTYLGGSGLEEGGIAVDSAASLRTGTTPRQFPRPDGLAPPCGPAMLCHELNAPLRAGLFHYLGSATRERHRIAVDSLATRSDGRTTRRLPTTGLSRLLARRG